MFREVVAARKETIEKHTTEVENTTTLIESAIEQMSRRLRDFDLNKKTMYEL